MAGERPKHEETWGRPHPNSIKGRPMSKEMRAKMKRNEIRYYQEYRVMNRWAGLGFSSGYEEEP